MITTLFDQLSDIVSKSFIGNGKEPVYYGKEISKSHAVRLEQMGFVENFHGYYFPTELGLAVHNTFNTPGGLHELKNLINTISNKG